MHRAAHLNLCCGVVCAQEFQDLWPHLDLVIDGGRITVGEGQEEEGPASRRGSTVVNLSQPGKFSVIREGRCVCVCVC